MTTPAGLIRTAPARKPSALRVQLGAFLRNGEEGVLGSRRDLRPTRSVIDRNDHDLDHAHARLLRLYGFARIAHHERHGRYRAGGWVVSLVIDLGEWVLLALILEG